MAQGFGKSKIALVVGGLLVVVGVWQLLQHFFGGFFDQFWRIVGIVVGVSSSLVIVAAGILLIIASRRAQANDTDARKLYRSSKNKKLAGVCGGIAEYLRVEPVVVRIITLVAGVICWYITIPLYILLYIVIPPDSERFNTWV
jgi:phage shock protein PspC (stress-responsive transcriptional regulator)